MLAWINSKLTTLDSYRLPLAHDYLESQNKSGHTEHYRRHFPMIRDPHTKGAKGRKGKQM